MDSFEAQARKRLSKQAKKLAGTLARKLAGYADGDIVRVEWLKLRVAWDLRDDSPHALYMGCTETQRWLEVECSRRAAGRFHVGIRPGRPEPDAFRKLCALQLPAAYTFEAKPMAAFAEALTTESARALTDFVVNEVDVDRGRVRVKAHGWPGVLYMSKKHRQRTLDDIHAMLDLTRALAAA